MVEKAQKLQYLDKLIQPRDPTETKEWYQNWAKDYDKDVVIMEYNGAQVAVNGFLKLNVPKGSRILDIGSGTGNVGRLLKLNGYINMDALDATEEMLEIAKMKNCYKTFINTFVSKDITLPIEDQSYDAIIMAGCLSPGHIQWDSFSQIIRTVKSGGIIFWVVSYRKASEDTDEIVESLCAENKWKYIKGYPKVVENYSRGNNGYVYAMRVL